MNTYYHTYYLQYGEVLLIKIPVTGNDACNIYVKWATMAGAEAALKVALNDSCVGRLGVKNISSLKKHTISVNCMILIRIVTVSYLEMLVAAELLYRFEQVYQFLYRFEQVYQLLVSL